MEAATGVQGVQVPDGEPEESGELPKFPFANKRKNNKVNNDKGGPDGK